MKTSALHYCQSLVRRADHTAYLQGLVLRGAVQRQCWFATRALNAELAAAVEEQRGTKLDWWRHSVNALYACAGAQPQQHPVLQALAPAVAQGMLSRVFVGRLLEAREQELERGPRHCYATMADLEAFGERCYATLNYLALEAAGVRSVEADHVASHLGKAAYIGIVLRGVPHLARQRQCMLPLELLAKHGLSQEALFSAESESASAPLVDVCYALAVQGRDHVLHADSIQGVPASAAVLRLLRVALLRHFAQFERVQFDPYRMMHARDPLLPLHLWWNS